MRKLSINAQNILDYLIEMLPEVTPGEPKTYITYSELHSQLGLPGTAQDLEFQGMRELATAISEAKLPGITGLIILKDVCVPGNGYFKLYGRENLDISWWEDEIKRVIAFDWSQYSKKAKLKASAEPLSISIPEIKNPFSSGDIGQRSSFPVDYQGHSPSQTLHDFGDLDTSTFRLLWSNGWCDFIPVRWLNQSCDWLDREHMTLSPDQHCYNTHCAGRVRDHSAYLDYGAAHELVNSQHHHIGKLTLTFKRQEEGACRIIKALWSEAGSADEEEPLSIELHQDPFKQLINYEPSTFEDARLYALRLVAMRKGQIAFRQTLIDAWNGRCAVTGCEIQDVLEAAHIVPHAIGGEGSYQACNGLLLRADIHTLFDLNRLRIMPDYRIETDGDIRSALGIPFRLRDDSIPAKLDLRPSQKFLTWRVNNYCRSR